MGQFVNKEDEKSAQLLEAYKKHEPLSDEEVKLLKLLRVHGKKLLPYIANNFKKLVCHMSDPLNISAMLAYRVSPAKTNSKRPDAINVTEMAAREGYSVSHITGLLRDQGYVVKYDRNRIYCLDKVITYVEVK